MRVRVWASTRVGEWTRERVGGGLAHSRTRPPAYPPTRFFILSLIFLTSLLSNGSFGPDLHASNLKQLSGPPVSGVQVQAIPEPSRFIGTVLAPFFTLVNYVERLGETGTPYLLFWLCLGFVIYAILDPIGRLRKAPISKPGNGNRGKVFLARLLLVFLFALQILFLCLYLSAFYGRSSRLLMPPRARVATPSDQQVPAVADFHCHSYLSTGLLAPSQLVEWHRRRGYTVMSITDSNRIAASVQARDYAQRYPDFHVLVGEEYKRSMRGLHLVLLGINREIRPNRFSPAAAVAEAHRQGGIAIVAHPWSAKGMTLQQMAALGVDGFEIFNGVMIASPELISFCQRNHLIMVGATDLKIGSETHVWNVLSLPRWIGIAKSSPEDKSILAALKKQRNSVLIFLDQRPIQGFQHPDWRPPANLWSPFLELGRTITGLTQAESFAWIGWLVVLVFAWSLSRRYVPSRDRYGRHLEPRSRPAGGRVRTLLNSDRVSGPRKSGGWFLLIVSAVAILITGAFTIAYQLKEIYPMPPDQCFITWIVLDVIALRSFRRIRLGGRIAHGDRLSQSRLLRR